MYLKYLLKTSSVKSGDISNLYVAFCESRFQRKQLAIECECKKYQLDLLGHICDDRKILTLPDKQTYFFKYYQTVIINTCLNLLSNYYIETIVLKHISLVSIKTYMVMCLVSADLDFKHRSFVTTKAHVFLQPLYCHQERPQALL